MAWISTISPNEADGELAKIYDSIARARGDIADVHQLQSLNVKALSAHLSLYKSIVFSSLSLSRIARERIAVVVSAENRCAYCVSHHAQALANLGDESNVIDAIAKGDIPATLPAADRELLSWARLGAKAPSQAAPSNIQTLKDLGFDDRAILDAALTVSYFSFVNRLVLLLGGSLEDGYEATCGSELTDGDREEKA